MLGVSVPSVLPTDPPDVVEALITAARVFRREPQDAIDWIRQAAQYANDLGHHERALELALAASDLAAQVKGSGTQPVASEVVTQDIDTSAFARAKKA